MLAGGLSELVEALETDSGLGKIQGVEPLGGLMKRSRATSVPKSFSSSLGSKSEVCYG